MIKRDFIRILRLAVSSVRKHIVRSLVKRGSVACFTKHSNNSISKLLQTFLIQTVKHWVDKDTDNKCLNDIQYLVCKLTDMIDTIARMKSIADLKVCSALF